MTRAGWGFDAPRGRRCRVQPGAEYAAGAGEDLDYGAVEKDSGCRALGGPVECVGCLHPSAVGMWIEAGPAAVDRECVGCLVELDLKAFPVAETYDDSPGPSRYFDLAVWSCPGAVGG